MPKIVKMMLLKKETLIRKPFELSHLRITYCDIQEDSRWGKYKELLKDTEKLRKELQKQYKKYKEI